MKLKQSSNIMKRFWISLTKDCPGFSIYTLSVHSMVGFRRRELSNLYELELGPFFLPKVATTLTKRRLYWMRRLARPVFFFFFSCFSTLDVCPLTLPARAREPWTLPPRRRAVISTVHNCGECKKENPDQFWNKALALTHVQNSRLSEYLEIIVQTALLYE